MLANTTVTPAKKMGEGLKSKAAIIIETKHEHTIASTVAKVLRMLSAYLMTTATSSPPPVLMSTTLHGIALNPPSSPRSETAAKSWCTMARSCRGTENMQSWMLRTHSVVLVPLSMRSRKTPAKPESRLQHATAISPSMGFASAPRLVVEESFHCTSTTPTTSSTSAAHCGPPISLPRMAMDQKAVESVFVWYSTWQTAGGRLESATKSRLFCSV
mmetsp:Transcript_32917/g.81829  ORF Transcript_32917/g.81829 Transcript_32917/m.81829 type:complete len:215 (+) Transcript_32917:281-925(+)